MVGFTLHFEKSGTNVITVCTFNAPVCPVKCVIIFYTGSLDRFLNTNM